MAPAVTPTPDAAWMTKSGAGFYPPPTGGGAAPAPFDIKKYIPHAQFALAGIQAGGILRRGREAERFAKQRAAIDRANAIAAEKASIERAKILAERGGRLKERQKAQFISGGIRTNVGVPLLVETQTRADIAKDIGFSLDVGRVEAGRFLSSAGIERRIGKYKRRKSKFEAIGVGAGAGFSFLGLG